MSKILQGVTEFVVWLLFVTSLGATIALTIAGAYRLIAAPQWTTLTLFVAAGVCLGIHYVVRQMPVAPKRGK